MLRAILRRLFVLSVRCFFLLLADLKVTGLENAPRQGPLIVVANHFSLYEVPLLAAKLPLIPTFFAAAELWDERIIRWGLWLNESILVRRGQSDRHALKRAFEVLEGGGVLAIFPEGGITAESVALALEGDTAAWTEGENSRHDARLLPAQPGVAFIALRTGVPILPVAITGTEKLEANLPRLKRTPIRMHVGEPFGPLKLDPTLRGTQRREQLRDLGHEMMRRVARLMPPENRGYYRDSYQL